MSLPTLYEYGQFGMMTLRGQTFVAYTIYCDYPINVLCRRYLLIIVLLEQVGNLIKIPTCNSISKRNITPCPKLRCYNKVV